jgi:hypothetical protein
MLRRCLLVAALSWAADFVAVAEIAKQSLWCDRVYGGLSHSYAPSLFSLSSNKVD